MYTDLTTSLQLYNGRPSLSDTLSANAQRVELTNGQPATLPEGYAEGALYLVANLNMTVDDIDDCLYDIVGEPFDFSTSDLYRTENSVADNT